MSRAPGGALRTQRPKSGGTLARRETLSRLRARGLDDRRPALHFRGNERGKSLRVHRRGHDSLGLESFAHIGKLQRPIYFGIESLDDFGGQVRSGRAIGLAISSEARLPEFPDVPTFAEMGYPDIVATVWFSLSGPANLPPEIVQRLNTEVNRALQLPDVRERLKSEGIVPTPMDAKAFTAFVAAEVKRWAPIVKASGAKND